MTESKVDETMMLSAAELKWLLTSPDAMRVLADYNDFQESMADSMGMPCRTNEARRKWFHAEARRIEAEWDAERVSGQRVFIAALAACTPAKEGGR